MHSVGLKPHVGLKPNAIDNSFTRDQTLQIPLKKF